MLVKTLFSVYALIGCTFAIPGFSTAGTEFVMGIPKYKFALIDELDLGYVFITTEEAVTTATISYTGNKSETKTKTIFRYESAEIRIPASAFVGDVGIHEVIYLKSTAPVRVCVIVQREYAIDAFRVTPKRSCSMSYYAVTYVGYPFIMVMTFSEPAKLNVVFPNYSSSFNATCNGSKECAPGASVDIYLGAFKMWYFGLKSWKSDLHNTLISSNVPINVITGSSTCKVVTGGVDICISSLKPTHAWGKIYLLPNFKKTLKVMTRINSKRFPFEVTVINNSNTTLKYKSHQDSHLFSARTHVVTSSKPFALYLFMLSNTANNGVDYVDAALVNIIPLEQWMNGLHFIPDIPLNTYKNRNFYLITYGNWKEVLSEKPIIKVWEKNTVAFNGKSFHVSRINVTDLSTSIYSLTPGGKVMMYVIGAPLDYSFFAYPYEYYISHIHHPDCKKGEPYESDGIDNDCDGFVDEEYLNDEDDDGDKLIDEDFVADVKGEGKWTAWYEACTSDCPQSGKMTKFYRSCALPSRFSKYCDGRGAKCLPRDDCLCGSAKLKWQCNCSPGCESCDKGHIDYAVCLKCKENVTLSPDCSTPCPRGWMGTGCSVKYGIDSDDDDGDDDGGSSFIPTVIGVLIGLPVLGALLYFFIVRSRNRKQEEGKKEDSVGMEENSEEAHGEAKEE